MLNLRELLMRGLHVKHELVPHLVPHVVSIWTVRGIYNFDIIKLLKEFFVRVFWILIFFMDQKPVKIWMSIQAVS